MTEYGLRPTILEHTEHLSIMTTYTTFKIGKIVIGAA